MDSILPLPWFARRSIRGRAREIASTLARHGLGWLVVQFGLGNLVPFQRGLLGHPPRGEPYAQAEHVRMALEELGATFIKLGQALSTRPDLLPDEYIEQLSRLQDAAPRVPHELICQVVQDEFGQGPETLFAEFDPNPLASASIGQVHAALLHSGQKVIVKVQRPGVAEHVGRDLEVLTSFAAWAQENTAFGRQYNLVDLVEEFAYTLQNELDYRREGHNADRFRRSFAGDAGVQIPRVFWEFTSDRVLTLERVEGVKISEVTQLDEAGINRRELAENAVRLMLREVFEFCFLHADPHPGNFFVRPDGSIALIDFGMVSSLDESLQMTLLRIGLAVTRQDSDRLADEFYKLGVAGGHVRREVLKRDLDHFLGRYARRSIQEMAAAQVTNEVMVIARRHRLQLPAELVMLFRVVAMSEGLGARLDPDFRLFEFAAPYLQRFWLAKYSPTAIGKRLAQSIFETVELGIDLPQHAARLLGQLERGDLAFDVHHEGLSEFTHQLQRMVNRLSLTIMLAATVIALGLLMIVYHPPAWERFGGWLFGLAFLFALGFGAWLIWNIWRSGR